MRNRLLLVYLATIAMLSANAQTIVQKYQPGVTSDGVVYYLPKTQINIAITATCTTNHPGDFHNYAQRFLRLNDVCHAEQTAWQIDNMQVATMGVPDTSKTYLVVLKKGTSAPLCTLTDDGILLAINAQAQRYEAPQLKEMRSSSNTRLNSRDYLNQEILSAGSELKMAELTAAEIYAIRESRNELTKGEADYMPQDGEQLKLMLAKLDEQEQALLQLFRGYTTTETKTWFFTYTPQYGVDSEVLARFSDQYGVVDKDDLSGAPITIAVNNRNTVAHGRTELLDKKLIDKVVYYNLPSQADLQITFGGNVLYKGQMPIAQFGHEEYLSDALFNKRVTCGLWLSTTTVNI